MYRGQTRNHVEQSKRTEGEIGVVGGAGPSFLARPTDDRIRHSVHRKGAQGRHGKGALRSHPTKPRLGRVLVKHWRGCDCRSAWRVGNLIGNRSSANLTDTGPELRRLPVA